MFPSRHAGSHGRRPAFPGGGGTTPDSSPSAEASLESRRRWMRRRRMEQQRRPSCHRASIRASTATRRPRPIFPVILSTGQESVAGGGREGGMGGRVSVDQTRMRHVVSADEIIGLDAECWRPTQRRRPAGAEPGPTREALPRPSLSVEVDRRESPCQYGGAMHLYLPFSSSLLAHLFRRGAVSSKVPEDDRCFGPSTMTAGETGNPGNGYIRACHAPYARGAFRHDG